MSDKSLNQQQIEDARTLRLAAALRDNLKRRKDQARLRASTGGQIHQAEMIDEDDVNLPQTPASSGV